VQFFIDLGLLEPSEPLGNLQNWQDLVPVSQRLRQARYPESIPVNISSVDPKLQEALTWLLTPPFPSPPSSPSATPMDAFASLLAAKLQYQDNERDIVILHHEIITKSAAAPYEELHTSSLITRGTKEFSAMARTVGLPVAIAALNVLDGKVHVRGVVGPNDESIREPVLAGLEEVGLAMIETSSRLLPSKPSLESSLHPFRI
jgi:alpha-aminoadipic semialdehyde synthase